MMVAKPAAKERAPNSHLFLLLGLGYSLDSSHRAGSGTHKPPATLSTVSRLSARVRPVLLIGDEKRIRPDVWHWSGYGRLVIEVHKIDAPTSAARHICDGLQSLMAVIGELPAPRGFVPHEIPQMILKGERISRRELGSIERHRDSYFDFLHFTTTIE